MSLGKRSTVNDDFRNRLESFFLTNFEGLWAFVEGVPWLRRRANSFLVNTAMRTGLATGFRP